MKRPGNTSPKKVSDQIWCKKHEIYFKIMKFDAKIYENSSISNQKITRQNEASREHFAEKASAKASDMDSR